MRLVALAVVLAATPAAAEDTVPARVTASLHGTTARFSLHLTAKADATTFPAATLELPLPARGLVTTATATIAGAAHPLALTPADDAHDAFYALGDPGGDQTAWAVLLAGSSGSVSIDIVAAESRVVALDLEVDAPTCFERGRRFAELPATWRGRITTVAAPKTCDVNGNAAWIAFPVTEPEHIGTLASRLPLSTTDLARVELDLARELADVPADLHTAIVIDASRSLTRDERSAQTAIIAAYLRSVPRTSVQVIGYARTAAPVLDGWTAAEAAAAPISRALGALHPANGSNLDAGLAEAGAWLARTTATRRVLLFTDERVARRLISSDGSEFAGSLPADTLVHVIALDRPHAALTRDDTVRFGALATATGGIGVRGGRGEATLLARPITLDDVAVKGDGWTDLGLTADCSGSLAAGTSCTWWARGDASSGPISVTGTLWSQPITRIVRPDPTHALAVARELSATGGLDAPLPAEIDRAALAVNAVWSLFAQWGGTGGSPSPMGFGTLSGIGSGHTTSTIVDTIGVTTVIPKIDLHAQLAGPLARCGAVHATIEIELTREEIVDVHVAGATGGTRSCLEDAVWSTLVTVPDAPQVSRATVVL